MVNLKTGMFIIIILFCFIPVMSTAQYSDQNNQNYEKKDGETSKEMAIKNMEKQKEEALKAGNTEFADAIEAKIKNIRSGKMTVEEATSESKGTYTSEKDTKLTPEKVIKNMEKQKEEALKAGNTEFADSIDAKIKNIRSGKMTVEEATSESKGTYTSEKDTKPTTERVLKNMEKQKEEALKAGETEKADLIDAKIKNFQSGSLTMDQVLSESKGTYKTEKDTKPTKEGVLKNMEKQKEEALKAGDFERVTKIEAMIKNFQSGKTTLKQITSEKEPDYTSEQTPPPILPSEGTGSQNLKKTSDLKPELKKPLAGKFSSEKADAGKKSKINSAENSKIVLSNLKKIKEQKLSSGNVKEAKEIDGIINDFEAGDIDSERLYALFRILTESQD